MRPELAGKKTGRTPSLRSYRSPYLLDDEREQADPRHMITALSGRCQGINELRPLMTLPARLTSWGGAATGFLHPVERSR